MIGPSEIRNQCLKWWKAVLLATIEGNPYFPREITKIGKIGSKDILKKLSDYKAAIERLKDEAKTDRKRGYRIVMIEKQFDKIGLQLVPAQIVIDSIEDYVHITGKGKEYQAFLTNFDLIQKELPLLIQWLRNFPLKLIEHHTWKDTLKVCRYFIQNPKPNLYIRQLPIDIHTKYIIENKAIITSLLNFLIPETINKEEKDFEKRFNLLSKEQLIRIRFLDTSKSPLQNVTDISFTESELKHYNFAIHKVFVTENLMNFLTLPFLKDTIAVWSGGGFNISYLRKIEWLKDKQFYYWGDIDAQGFQILNQCRTYFPNTIAVMMDRETLDCFQYSEGVPAKNQRLGLLTDAETHLYDYVCDENIRLEQEKITQAFAEKKIEETFSTNVYQL